MRMAVTGEIIYAGGVGGQPVEWGGELVTNSTYAGKVKGQDTVTMRVTVEQGGVEVFRKDSFPFSEPGPGFGVIFVFDPSTGTGDTSQEGQGRAELIFTDHQGQSVTETVLDESSFTVHVAE